MGLSYKQEERLKKALDGRKKKDAERRANYEQNPNKCGFCKNNLPFEKRKNKFCSHSCSASVGNLGEVRNFVSGRRAKKNCLFCGKITDNPVFCSSDCNSEYIKKTRLDEIEKTGILTGTPSTAKKYLIEIRGYKCEICGCQEWNGQPVPLVLDHIDGKPSNPKLENLRLVCGNCNMQLPTFAGRNVGKGGGRPYRNQRYLQGKSW